MSDDPENTGSEVVRAPDGRWKPGAGSPNAGGRPRKLREIETMLDEEHRTVENMRPVFARLKFLALGEPVEVMFRGSVVRIELKADAAFMSLYLDRVLGPMAKGQIDLSDAPQEVVDYLAHKLH